ncbi:MAG: MBL fold metallo-hydrolase [Pseudoflavonifractor sp.]|nr:MBL fold metallo-hydrolase [Pseudoflavonifractor sp.]
MKIEKFTFNMFGVNTFVVWDPATREAAIIDPGMIDSAETAVIDDFISANELTVTHLINTHLHLDHTFGNKYVKSRYGLPVEAGIDDAELGAYMEQQSRRFGLRHVGRPVVIEHPLKEGDTVRIGTGKLKVLHVPGHSPGSIALYSPADKFVIAGDVLFRSSIGRTDLPGGDYATLIKSIQEKLLTLPDDTIVYPGHGPATRIDIERDHNPYI